MKIQTVKTQKVLAATQISLADYVINPYRGCEFGCVYCYSQDNQNIKRDGFESILSLKTNAPDVLAKELRFVKPRRVLLGSTTECFQYSEKTYHISEAILTILNQRKIPYTILTKSHLIADYLPLIKQNPQNKIYFTFNFASDSLIALFEKKSPSIAQRLETIKKIINEGIALRIHIGPYIPYVSDYEAILNLLPAGINEIDIELYHQKQGNFRQIMQAVQKAIGQETAQKLEKIYSDADCYETYAQQLQQNAMASAKQRNLTIYCIIPDFNKFYTPKIVYG